MNLARLRAAETDIEIDNNGRLLSILHHPTGTEFVRGTGSGWKLIASLGEWTEHPAFDHDQEGRIDATDSRVLITFDAIKGLAATQPIRLELEFIAAPQGIECRWTMENRSVDTVREFSFPFLSGLQADKATLPFWCGARWSRPHEALPPHWLIGWADSPITYPGTASMSWMHIESGSAGLYLGSHDPSLPSTALLARRRPLHGDFQLGFSRYPLLPPGSRSQSGTFLLAAHAGDWRRGSNIYRAYAHSWMDRLSPRQTWLSEAPALCALFMKHQNKRQYFPYSRLAEIAAEHKASGLDIPLFPFSWYKSGHDSGFPEYEPDPLMGGESALKEALAAVKAAGQRTILYTQGRLMDIAGRYFRDGEGWDASYIAEDGNPHCDRYSWPIQSTIDPGKHFAVGCPGSASWRDKLRAQAELVMDLGADGLLYDQIGGDQPYLCFGRDHDHARPDLAGASKVSILRQLRDRLHARGGALMLELTCDAFVQFVDLCHSKGTNFTDPGFPHPTFAEMYRYTFPEHPVSSRDAQREDEVRYAWLIGLVPEYWRMTEPFEHVDRCYDCDPGQRAVAEYRARMNGTRREIETVIRARKAVYPIARGGDYRGSDGIGCDNDGVRISRYAGEDRDAVLVWNTRNASTDADIGWEGTGCVNLFRLTPDGVSRRETLAGKLPLAGGERVVLVRDLK